MQLSINQILPDFITCDIPVKPALILTILKQDTSKYLKELSNKYSLNKIHLKTNQFNNNKTISNDDIYKYPSSFKINKTNKDNEFMEYDCSFLKRVKPSKDVSDHRYIIITFIDELEYLHKNINDIINEFNIKNKNLLKIVDIPHKQPISEKQYEQAKSFWPICILVSSKEKFIYNHTTTEEAQILSHFNNLINDKEYTSYIINPETNELLCKGKENKNSLINHSIMNLLSNFASCLLNKSSLLGIKKEDSPQDNTVSLFGTNNNSEQYYCENLCVLILNEPCPMCAMALVHNRIKRIYFMNYNSVDGALVSKLCLNNYNLNHHYQIFKINNDK